MHAQPSTRRSVRNRLLIAAIAAAATVLVISLVKTRWDPPAQQRERQREECRKLYREARTAADSLKADYYVVNPHTARSASRDESCRELRARGELQ